MSGKYDDVIQMQHHQSDHRPHMPLSERAAQFMPFAALTGYDAAIAEAGRLTEAFHELDEHEKMLLDATLSLLEKERELRPEVTILHFVPDDAKEGGAYVKTKGRYLKTDPQRRVIVLEDGITIELDEIADIRRG